MRQQINLYKFLPVERKFQLTPKKVLFIYSLLVLVLFLKMLFSFWTLHEQNQTKNILLVQLKTEQAKLNEITKRYPIINPTNLQGTVQELRRQLDQRVKLASVLSQSGFTFLLEKLSQSIIPTVWLNEILISNTEQRIVLRGFSIQALPIQLFLDRLNQVRIFDDELIDLQNVTQIKNKNNLLYLSFEVSNKTGTPNEQTGT